MKHTKGLTNELLSFPKTLKASVSVCAPLTTSPAFWLPTYSRMLFNWSSVGGSSLMSSSNSVLSFEACGFVDEAWSSVAYATAFARLCLRRVRTRLLEEIDGEWKRVTTSFAPCYWVVLAPACGRASKTINPSLKLDIMVWKAEGSFCLPLQIASSTYCLCFAVISLFAKMVRDDEAWQVTSVYIKQWAENCVCTWFYVSSQFFSVDVRTTFDGVKSSIIQ